MVESMAKSLLNGFKIGSDVIDAVVSDSSPEEPEDAVFVSFLRDSGTPETPPPVGPRNLETEDAKTAHTDTANNFDALICEKDGLFQIFRIGEVTYRLGGIKSLFVTSLRVNMRASDGQTSYYDSIDLYAARGRASFSQGVNRAWGAEPLRVERDLILILEHLEKERDEALRVGSKRAMVEMTHADRELGLDLLRDPLLFERIVSDLTSLGYVGEELNKQLLYLCASSRKLDDPISVLILSQSASGKSFLVDSVKKLMPPEDVVAVTSLSDQALNYIEGLTHKC